MKQITLFFSLLLFAFAGIAQVAINTDGAPAHESAILDVSSSLKGMLIPRLTTTQRTNISSPATGLLVFDSDLSVFYYYNGTEWAALEQSVISLNDITDAKTLGGSVFIGIGSGASQSSPSTNNTALGANSLTSTTTGKSNTSIGYKSMAFNTEGNYNNAVGLESLGSNTSGSNNNAYGFTSMYNNTTGTNNVGIGTQVLFNNSTGIENTVVGNLANYYNQTGSTNTIIGFEAGKGTTLHDKSGNVFLGYKSGFFEQGSNKLYIENSASGSPLIYGEFDNDLVRVNGILNINSAYEFPIVDGSSGQVLKTDGSGMLTWSGEVGATQINDLSDAISGSKSLFVGNECGINTVDLENENSGFGIAALKDNTTGYENTAIGWNALSQNVAGFRNTAIGPESLLDNIDGNYNTAIGPNSATYNISGNNNISIGYSAQYYNQAGSNNVGIGNSANINNHNGSNNTTIGFEAGKGTEYMNKSGNVMIGYQAGYSENGSNRLYIENSNSSSPLIYGEFDNDLLRINGTLDINNAYQLPTTDGTSGQTLVSDGSGTLAWTEAGATNINELSDGKTDVSSIFLGTNTGNLDDGSNYNVGFGQSAFQTNTSGSHSVAIGYSALYLNTTGQYNVAVGSSTLRNNTIGEGNTSIGHQALYSNTQGATNVGIGMGSLFSNNTGSSNVAIGHVSLFKNTSQSHNVAVGDSSLYFNGFGATLSTDAIKNTAVGARSLVNNTTGPSNSAFGYMALHQNTEGEDNCAMGVFALKSNIDGSQNVAIGNQALQSHTSGNINVGIGCGALLNSTSGSINVAVGGLAAQYTTVGIGNTAIGSTALNANVDGVNNTALGYNSFVNGSSYSNSTAIGVSAQPSSSNQVCIGNTAVTWIGGQVTWSTYSDGKAKKDVSEDVVGLDFITRLRPVTYYFDKDKMDELIGISDSISYPDKYNINMIKQSGFIAQEVEAAAVATGYNFSGIKKPEGQKDYYSLSYAEFVVPLVKAVQEQQITIQAQQETINELKKMEQELMELKEKIRLLEDMN